MFFFLTFTREFGKLLRALVALLTDDALLAAALAVVDVAALQRDNHVLRIHVREPHVNTALQRNQLRGKNPRENHALIVSTC